MIVRSPHPYIPTCGWSLWLNCCVAEGVTEECTLRVLLLTVSRILTSQQPNAATEIQLRFFEPIYQIRQIKQIKQIWQMKDTKVFFYH